MIRSSDTLCVERGLRLERNIACFFVFGTFNAVWRWQISTTNGGEVLGQAARSVALPPYRNPTARGALSVAFELPQLCRYKRHDIPWFHYRVTMSGRLQPAPTPNTIFGCFLSWGKITRAIGEVHTSQDQIEYPNCNETRQQKTTRRLV